MRSDTYTPPASLQHLVLLRTNKIPLPKGFAITTQVRVPLGKFGVRNALLAFQLPRGW